MKLLSNKMLAISRQPMLCHLIVCSLISCCFSASLYAARPGSADAACDALNLRYRSAPSAATDREMNFFLFDAAAQGCLELAQQFLNADASIKARDRFGNSPLLIAARMGHIDILELLLENGADPHQKNLAGSSSLLRAVTMNRRKVVKRLLEIGVDPNLANNTEITPLITSVYNGHLSITKMLLEAGADPAITDASGKSPVVYAAGKGYFALLKLLLESKEIDINTHYGNDLTVLMWAAGHSNDVPEQEGLKTVEYVLARNPDIDARDNRHKTALMIAAERGHMLIVETLILNGADIALLDRDGNSAIELAASERIKALLVKSSVDGG